MDNLIRAQRALGHDVLLVTRFKQWLRLRKCNFSYQALPLPPKAFDPFDYEGGAGHRWPVAITAAVYQWIGQFDVWHIHGIYPAGWQLLPALRTLKIPVVLTAHGADVGVLPKYGHGYRLYPKHEPRIQHTISEAPVLTAISNTIVDEYLSLGASPEKIVSVPNGVDVRRIGDRHIDRCRVRQALGWPLDIPVIITVGRNYPTKGLNYIPKTIQALRRSVYKFLLVIVGSDLDSIAEMAKEEGVDAYLKTYPPIGARDCENQLFPPTRLVDFLKAADVFAFPSEIEAFGLVVLEAMAAGVPVVTTNAPGLRDVVVDGVSGLLCPVGEPDAMATLIAKVLADVDLRRRLTAQALVDAEQYDWRLVAQRYLTVYKQLINQWH